MINSFSVHGGKLNYSTTKNPLPTYYWVWLIAKINKFLAEEVFLEDELSLE